MKVVKPVVEVKESGVWILDAVLEAATVLKSGEGAGE